MKLSKKIIQGSRILNQKRGEIIEVLKILSGLLAARATVDTAYKIQCPDGFYWQVDQTAAGKGDRAKSASVIIRFVQNKYEAGNEILLQTPTEETIGKSCTMKNIARIHENLDTLIIELHERYPSTLRPLLEAEE